MRLFGLVMPFGLWSACASAMPPSAFVHAYDTMYFADASVGYVGSSDALIKTTDSGAHWTLVRTATRDGPVGDVVPSVPSSK